MEDFTCEPCRKWRKMKNRLMLCVAGLMALAGLSLAGQGTDPTRPTERMADRLAARATDTSAFRLQALVVGAGDDGVALVGTSGLGLAPVRKGATFTTRVDDVDLTVKVKSVRRRLFQ